jgi:hypothetical protein
MAGDRSFAFRLIRASWGLAVDITARIEPGWVPGADPVSGGLWLALPRVGLAQADEVEARRAVTARAGWLSTPCTIVLQSVSYTPTDYQPEAVGWALEAWLAEETGQDDFHLHIKFDADANRYVLSNA